MSNVMKFCPVGTELFHADGWTDRRTGVTNVVVLIGNFANASKNKNNPRSSLALKTTHCWEIVDFLKD